MMLAATARRLYLTNLYSCKLALSTCLRRQSSQHTSGNRACERIYWNTRSISGCTQISGTRVWQMWVNTHAIFPACILPLSLLIWCSLRLAPMIYILYTCIIMNFADFRNFFVMKYFDSHTRYNKIICTVCSVQDGESDYICIYIMYTCFEHILKIAKFNKNIKYIL